MFRLVSVRGRAALDVAGEYFDVARVAGDPALSEPLTCLSRFDSLHALTLQCAGEKPDGRTGAVTLDAPVAGARQVFGIGLNFGDHAAEGGMELPPSPLTFTKFPSCLAGPTAPIVLSGPSVDWEAELVVVIGAECHNVGESDAWSVVAGLTAGQDVSDRDAQFVGKSPQFSLGKSFPGYGPIGPAVVSTDSFEDRDNVRLSCHVSGELMQESSTSLLIFGVARLVSFLSSICTLYPGDLIFTGTPSGVGMARGRYLRPGDEVVTAIEGIGELRNVCVAR